VVLLVVMTKQGMPILTSIECSYQKKEKRKGSLVDAILVH
jgi:hypothetical protein